MYNDKTFWPTFEFFGTYFLEISFWYFAILHFILGTFNEWGTWSSCSVTCGTGTRSRSRTCPGPHQCQGDTTESDTCPDNPTCYSEFSHIYFGQKINFWSRHKLNFTRIFWTNLKIWYNCYILDAWGEWSSCSVTCGSGTRTRTRTCPDSMCSASDAASETDTCPSNPTCYSKLQRNTRWYIFVTYNEITGDWGEWSSCSVTCGTGTRTRTRTCPDSMCSASESSSETDNCPNNPSCMGKINIPNLTWSNLNHPL